MVKPLERPRRRPVRHVLMVLQWYSHLYHRGIARYAREANWSLDAASVHYGRCHVSDDLDGVIGLLTWKSPLLETLRARRLPTVDMCLMLPNLRMPRVLQDNERIGEEVAAHFFARGFRHFAFCRSAPDDWAGVERLRGFRRLLRRRGYDCADVMLPGETMAETTGASYIPWLGTQLRALPKPLAVLAQHDDFAAEVLQACLHAGLDVPSDVAIVGCDNDELVCDVARVPLSSVDSNLEGQAYEAARLLDHLMDGGRPPRRPRRVPHRGLVVRQSSDILAIEHPGLAAAISAIWRDYGNPALSVKTLAAKAGVTRQGLDKACRKHLGRTVSDELKRVRLAKALAWIAGTDHKIGAIAGACGYSRPKHLRDTVRRATGQTPLAYRRAQHRA